LPSQLTRIAILALSVALLLLSPAVAPAADTSLGIVGDLEYRSDTTSSVGAPSVSTADVECSGGFPYVLGGGTTMNGIQVQTHIATSAPIDSLLDTDDTPDNGWRGTMANDSGDPKDLTAFAICSALQPNLRMKATTIPLKGDTTGTVTAKCAKKAHATGGGFLIGTANPQMVHAIEDRPWDSDDRDKAPDDGWRARAFNNAGSTAELAAYVMCIRGGGLSYPRHGDSNDILGIQVDVPCAEQASVTGGGMKISGPADEAYINASNPVDTKLDADSIPNNGWSGVGTTLNGRKKFTGYAICYEAP